MAYVQITDAFPLRAGYAGPVEVSEAWLRSLMATEADRLDAIGTCMMPGVPSTKNPVRERAQAAIRAVATPELKAWVHLNGGSSADVAEFQVINDWNKLRRLILVAASKDWLADAPATTAAKAPAKVKA